MPIDISVLEVVEYIDTIKLRARIPGVQIRKWLGQ